MRVLVTGGAGFIGSTLVDRLLAAEMDVTAVDDLSTGALVNTERAHTNDRYQLIRHDIADPSTAEVVEQVRPDVVVHLAAQIDVRRSVEDPVADAMVNLVGGLQILDGARRAGVQKFVFVSSGGAVYGDAAEELLPLDENTPQHPLSPYGASKKAFVDYLEVYRQLHGLPWAAIAPANVYGPRQGVGGEGGVVAIFCRQALAGERCVIFGDGATTRDFVHVDDVVDAIVRAMSSGSGFYNIGTGVETSLEKLFSVVSNAVGVPPELERRPERPGDIRRSSLNASRAWGELGWSPRVSLSEGVRTVVDFLRM
jgi:UDP-glucose 4-epimerase